MKAIKKPAPSNYEKIPKSYLTRKYEQYKEKVEVNREIQKAARHEGYKRKKELALKEAKLKEDYKSQARIKKYKEKANRKPLSFDFKGIAGPTQQKGNVGLDMANYLTGSGGGSKKKKPFDMNKIL